MILTNFNLDLEIKVWGDFFLAKGEPILHWEVAAKVLMTFVWFPWELQVDDNAESLLLFFFILPKCFLLLLVAMGGVNVVQPAQINPCIVMFLLYVFRVCFTSKQTS